MTQSEKDGFRSRRLERYQRAIDEYNNHCKRLDEYVDTMRDVVRLYDDGDLHAFVLPCFRTVRNGSGPTATASGSDSRRTTTWRMRSSNAAKRGRNGIVYMPESNRPEPPRMLWMRRGSDPF